jgi:hypothetical protein
MLSLVSLNFFSLGFAISTACFLLTAEPITDILEFLAKQYTTVQGNAVKGIVQPFELGPVTSLVRSAVKFCEAGHFQKNFLMIQSHERSLKPISAA